MSPLLETKIVRFEVLEREKRDWPAASTTTELRVLEAPGILILMDGRLRLVRLVVTLMRVDLAAGDE